MHFNDRPELRNKLVEMATVVGRTVDSDEADAYFNQLEEYPIDLITKGMDKALRDRDPTDIFIQNSIVTVPEIRAAIEDMARPEEGQIGTVAGCKKCNGGGWIMGQDEKKRTIAWPCQCLYNVAKEALGKKGKWSDDAWKKRVISAYEYHQKKWGMTPETEKEAL